MTRAVATLGALAACGSAPPPRLTAAEVAPPPSAGGAYSPSGDRHPGLITYEDHVEHRTWTRHALEVPATIAWVKVGERWRPVVTIEIQGTAQLREITTYGPEHELLEHTTARLAAPPPAAEPQYPAPRSLAPIPVEER